VNLFRVIPGYTSVIYDEGKEPLLLLLQAPITRTNLLGSYI
jgi:hypothetical protein